MNHEGWFRFGCMFLHWRIKQRKFCIVKWYSKGGKNLSEFRAMPFQWSLQAPKCLQFAHQKQDALGSRQRKRDGLGGEDPSVVCAARTKVAPKEVQASNRGQFFRFKIQVVCLRLTVINRCGWSYSNTYQLVLERFDLALRAATRLISSHWLACGPMSSLDVLMQSFGRSAHVCRCFGQILYKCALLHPIPQVELAPEGVDPELGWIGSGGQPWNDESNDERGWKYSVGTNGTYGIYMYLQYMAVTYAVLQIIFLVWEGTAKFETVVLTLERPCTGEWVSQLKQL